MKTQHQYLQLVVAGEEQEIHELFCNPKVYEYLADGAEPPRAISDDWVRAASRDFDCYGGGLWSFRCVEEQRMLGLVRLSDFDADALELTYLLHPDVWGHGHAVRMSHTAMNHAFEVGNVKSIWAGADVPNVASIAVMKKLGMRLRGSVAYPAGPGVEYAVSRSEFDPARAQLLPLETNRG